MIRKSPVWYCGRCTKAICDETENSIVCESFLTWFHFDCMSLKQCPKRSVVLPWMLLKSSLLHGVCILIHSLMVCIYVYNILIRSLMVCMYIIFSFTLSWSVYMYIIFSSTFSYRQHSMHHVKPEQMEVVEAYVQGCGVFAVLPTGYGKSLCYGCLPIVFNNLTKGHEENHSIVQGRRSRYRRPSNCGTNVDAAYYILLARENRRACALVA